MTPFSLREVRGVVGSGHGSSAQSTPRDRPASSGAGTSQPRTGAEARIRARAAAADCLWTRRRFAERLDGPQVGAELLNLFRDTPEFGRSLATRLEPFLDESVQGAWQLIGGGGEAAVFFDESAQRVVKLFAPPGKARFGWIPERRGDGSWGLRPGEVVEALERFAVFEECFESGLEIEAMGEDGGFLLLSQPFVLGEHPDEPTLHAFMAREGWRKCELRSELPMLRHQSWQRDGVLATDVRPENALLAQSDGTLVGIDFVVGAL